MKLRRDKPVEKPVSEFIASSVVESARTLDRAAAEYPALLAASDDDRTRAKARLHAQGLAVVVRGLLLFREQIEEEVQEPALPFVALEPARRLCYAYVALAQEPRDQRTLLTLEELDDLMDEAVERWIRGLRVAWTEP